MTTTQLNVRIDQELKASGDAVLERFGVSTVQVIREMWRYMADHQRLPDFCQQNSPASPAAESEAARVAEHGAGMAARLAREAGLRAEFESMTYRELRESAYEEDLIEKEESRA